MLLKKYAQSKPFLDRRYFRRDSADVVFTVGVRRSAFVSCGRVVLPLGRPLCYLIKDHQLRDINIGTWAILKT